MLRTAFDDWNDHDGPRMGAALAFYAILSLAPLVILAIAIASLIFVHSTVESQLTAQIEGVIGRQGSDLVRGMIEQAQEPASSTAASLIGLITLLFGASGVFGELRSALNKMWDIKTQNDGGVWGVIRERLFSFGMVLAVGFLLLVSLVISAGLAACGKFFAGLLPMPSFILEAINFAVSLAGITVLFALILRYVPETTISWKVAGIGAAVTALLFTVGKLLIGLLSGKSSRGFGLRCCRVTYCCYRLGLLFGDDLFLWG